MNEYEFENLAMLLEHLESARVIAMAKFEYHASNKDYDKALIFQGMRDRLDAEVKTITSYIWLNKEGEQE